MSVKITLTNTLSLGQTATPKGPQQAWQVTFALDGEAFNVTMETSVMATDMLHAQSEARRRLTLFLKDAHAASRVLRPA